ncbi:MAG TPA: hypothetical protein VNW47_08955 [Terriglobales bacterium]|jgi:hypothetical protein|nr:hypothetical protein [Terriglobales bacterium]
MTPSLIWIDEPENNGWACSSCSWKYPVPTFLSDPEAKRAYDRLAASKFGEHICELPAPHREIEDTSTEPTFTKRVMKLLKVGYKPKDAVQIALDEIALEHRNDPKVMSQARVDAQDFMQRVREGRI